MSNPVLARIAIGRPAQPGDGLAQRAVVDVEGAPPDDAARIDAGLIAPMNVIVDHRREQIVGGGDGVEIAGEMQVDIDHRRDLRPSAAGRPALLAENRAHRRLAQADRRALADKAQRVAEADRRRGLALAGRRRIDRRDQDQLAVGPLGERIEKIEIDLGDVPAIGMKRRFRDAELGGDGPDRFELGGLSDFDIAFHRATILWRPAARNRRRA